MECCKMVEVGLISGVTLIAVICGMTQVIKNLGIDAKFLPVANILMGIILGVSFYEGTMQEKVFFGLVGGLSASGLYDQTKIFKK